MTNQRSRRLRQASLIAAAILMTVAGLAEPARADSSVGSGTTYSGPYPSNGYAYWNKNTRTLNLHASGYQMTSGKCETSFFDWRITGGGHFDARAVRTCVVATSSYSGVSIETAGSDFSFLGIRKFHVCYGNNNTLTGCVKSPQTVDNSGTFQASLTTSNMTTRYWLNNASGNTSYHDGGNSRRYDG